ncbi:hypothetical protein C5C95_15000 [Rathayibacter sp. AY1B7]|nr:hypothetical protein C5C95_15000 [Rathayibacter sp. AY1B7]
MNVGTGFHVPGLAVRVDPTVVAPVIVGTGAVVNATGVVVIVAVGADVFEVVVKPSFVPVTATVSVAPASAVTRV